MFMPYALGSYSQWSNPITYYFDTWIGTDHYQFWSLPYLKMEHDNIHVPDTSWTASFKVLEKELVTSASGNSWIYYGSNVFYYGNVKLAFSCGKYTTFDYTMQQGQMIKSTNGSGAIASAGTGIAITALKYGISHIPVGSEILEGIGYLAKLIPSSTTVTLGDSAVSLTDTATLSVGEQLSNYTFKTCSDHDGGTNNGDYFIFKVMAKTLGMGTLPPTSTSGGLQFSASVRSSASNGPNIDIISQHFTLPYTVYNQ